MNRVPFALARKSPDSRFTLVFLAASIGFGMFLRIHNLGKFGFWIDELFHVIGAQSLLETGSPVIPGMLVYKRAYPITALTALFFKNFGINEAVGRTPSVIAGAIFLVAGYFLVRRLFDRPLAVLFTFVMALSPLEILWDRQCRMYALFRMLYFSATMLFLMGFEAEQTGRKFRGPRFLQRTEKDLGINLILLALAGILLFASKTLHPLSYNFALVLSVYCSFMFLSTMLRSGIRSAFLSKYFVVIVSMVAGVIFIRLYSPGIFYGLLNVIAEKPFWDTYDLDYMYYLRYLWENYPVLLIIYPAGIWSLISRYGKRGFYIFCSFAPLFFLHMFLFSNNINERYILYIFPFFAIGAISCVEILLIKLARHVAELWSSKKIWGSVAFSSSMIILLAVASFPWVGSAFAIPWNPHFDDWKSVSHVLKSIPRESVIVSTRRMPLYFYYGKNPDYVTIKDFEGLIKKEIQYPSKNRPLFMDVKWLFSAEELERVIRENDQVYFLLDTDSYWNPAFIDQEIRQSISLNFKLQKHEGDHRILIFKKIL